MQKSYLYTIKKCLSHTNIMTKIKSKIFGFLLGNLQPSSNIFDSLRKSSAVFVNLRYSLSSIGGTELSPFLDRNLINLGRNKLTPTTS